MRQRILTLAIIILTFALTTGVVFAEEATEAAEATQLNPMVMMVIGIGSILAVGAALYSQNTNKQD